VTNPKKAPFKKLDCFLLKRKLLKMPGLALKIYLAHLAYEGKDRQSYPAVETLKKVCAIHNEHTIFKWRKWLVKNGWLVPIGGKHTGASEFTIPIFTCLYDGTIPGEIRDGRKGNRVRRTPRTPTNGSTPRTPTNGTHSTPTNDTLSRTIQVDREQPQKQEQKQGLSSFEKQHQNQEQNQPTLSSTTKSKGGVLAPSTLRTIAKREARMNRLRARAGKPVPAPKTCDVFDCDNPCPAGQKYCDPCLKNLQGSRVPV